MKQEATRLCNRKSIAHCIPLDLSIFPTVCMCERWHWTCLRYLCVFARQQERSQQRCSFCLLSDIGVRFPPICCSWCLHIPVTTGGCCPSEWGRITGLCVCVSMRAESSMLPSNPNALWESLRENEKHTWMGKQETVRNSFAEYKKTALRRWYAGLGCFRMVFQPAGLSVWPPVSAQNPAKETGLTRFTNLGD